MARFSGVVGFYTGQEEVRPGIFQEAYEEHRLRGDTLRSGYNQSENQTKYDTLRLNNRVSLLGDTYSFNNINAIRYVTINGQSWKVSSVEIQRPRLILEIGEVWNNEQA